MATSAMQRPCVRICILLVTRNLWGIGKGAQSTGVAPVRTKDPVSYHQILCILCCAAYILLRSAS